MGMITTHRYIILSNHMIDLTDYDKDTNWGWCIAQRNGHFKVLGTNVYKGKTGIFLMHLPDDEDWMLFQKYTFSLEQDLMERAVQRFVEKCQAPPVPELTRPEWLRRCEIPLGIDANGNFTPLINPRTE